ncbi:hypothetical protein BHU72_05610 [Desulfuribacillus stibiiarsenatis]|uniref:Diguanylate cyclase n=1 Tax=Desulfuribacillus stibiiarsenatis TaxID=1390249 RepID=A0A1E5L4P9_9FIRM|nr:GGDEF domain-containing phosphodiesterase [Desulfuribacillus stibiiarsenatis]OEH85086.1 hypothetical protein BHU72_05610 [Desulfuribacillus stibiiarsenatis]
MWNFSLRQSLLAYYIIITSVILFIIGVAVNQIAVTYLHSGIENSIESVAEVVEHHTGEYFTQSSEFLYYVKNSIIESNTNDDQNLQFMLNQIHKNQFLFEAFEILDDSFKVNHVSPYNEIFIGLDRSKDINEKLLVSDSTGPKREGWTSTITSLYSKKVTLAHVIDLEDNRYLVGYLDLSNINLIGSQLDNEQLNISILDDKGIYITDNNILLTEQRAYHPDYSTLLNYYRNGQKFVAHDYLGIPSHIYINNVPKTNWLLVVAHSGDTVKQLSTDIRNAIVVVFSIAMLIIVLLTIISTRKILEPVHRIHDKFGELILDNKISLVEYSGYREFENIIKQFNDMLLKLKEKDTRIHKMVYFDSLTGLPNRKMIESKIEKLVNANTPFTIAYLDIDNFKFINDSLGHQAGDQFLIYMANIFKKSVKSNCLIARQGGDEFVLLFKDLSDEEEIRLEINQFVKGIQHIWEFNHYEFFISCSIGIVTFPKHGRDCATLFKNADIAMYRAKKEGKNKFIFYTEDILVDNNENIQMAKNIQSAIVNEQFELYYQPQVNLSDGVVEGFEALIRWKHPEKGFISPADFIPVAEETGQIFEIEKWVLINAIQQKKVFEEAGRPDLSISINLSSKTLTSDINFNEIEQMVRLFDVDFQSITLEITETAVLTNVELVVRRLNKLRQIGFKIALDDFGTGFSSLNHLKTLPIHIIKLDRSFIKSIENSDKDTKIIQSIIALAKDLEYKVVAEGIETEQQLEFLRQCGCMAGQGFLMSRPLPNEEVERLLENGITIGGANYESK